MGFLRDAGTHPANSSFLLWCGWFALRAQNSNSGNTNPGFAVLICQRPFRIHLGAAPSSIEASLEPHLPRAERLRFKGFVRLLRFRKVSGSGKRRGRNQGPSVFRLAQAPDPVNCRVDWQWPESIGAHDQDPVEIRRHEVRFTLGKPIELQNVDEGIQVFPIIKASWIVCWHVRFDVPEERSQPVPTPMIEKLPTRKNRTSPTSLMA